MLRHIITFFVLFLLSIALALPITLERRDEILAEDGESLPKALDSVCGGRNATTILTSKAFGTHGVRITTGVCSPPESESTSDSNSVDLEARQASCRTAPNNCIQRFGTMFQGNGWVNKCGAQCDSSCYPGSNGPDPNHCQFIFNSMFAEQPQLLTLEPNNFLLLTYRSCGTGIQNQIASGPDGCSTKMIYDYSDWAAIGRYLAWNCQAPQGARGGRCVGRTGLYQGNIPDYYVQVYQNQ